MKLKKRRKWVRNGRKHSLSAGHIDWHEWDGTRIKVCVILDDASRMILADREFDMLMTFVFSSLDDSRGIINTENSKKVIDQMVERYWWLCPMRELIFDHGSALGDYRVHENGDWNQTNGDLERFFGEFKRHRHAFSSFEEFIEWYNNRPHGILEFERFETPEMVFRRKMPQEAYYRIGRKLFGL
jgi:putative transposase